MKSLYTDIINRIAADAGVDVDPRHVEGFMRLQYSYLDHLDRATFKREILLTQEIIRTEGIDVAESCARSYGL